VGGGGSPTQGGGWVSVVNRTLRVVTLRVVNITPKPCHTKTEPTGGVPSQPPLYVCIIRLVGVWFCWFEPPPWEVGGCLVTVCGFGFVSCWEIYAYVCISLSDGGQRVMGVCSPHGSHFVCWSP